jgi:hypothetical protein
MPAIRKGPLPITKVIEKLFSRANAASPERIMENLPRFAIVPHAFLAPPLPNASP